jgi:hypothetical protein
MECSTPDSSLVMSFSVLYSLGTSTLSLVTSFLMGLMKVRFCEVYYSKEDYYIHRVRNVSLDSRRNRTSTLLIP